MYPYSTHTPMDDGGSSSEDEPEARDDVFTRPKGRSSRGFQPLRPSDPDFPLLMDYRYYRFPRPDRHDRADQMRELVKNA